ncbi:HSF-type DNA-binding protein [Nitzschia inconspicua]|uniref:HSF-type DNA-binding protein n=1 Tax=Nitzschia inconspicua TaxID=303405 RepID=A0A9K3M3I2_9STRA|nr:HSF-type DNA-binding protein [Nitzschia inconspicua]
MMRRSREEEEQDYRKRIRVATATSFPGRQQQNERKVEREGQQTGTNVSASTSPHATATTANGTDTSSKDEEASSQDNAITNTHKLPFPWKLHKLLEHAEKEGYQDIISWEPDGKSFRVHKPIQFCESILGKFFRQSKYESFTRQLYIYGFSKVEGKGPSTGGFRHPQFLRDNRNLTLTLGRNQAGDRRRKRSLVNTDPSTNSSTSFATSFLFGNMAVPQQSRDFLSSSTETQQPFGIDLCALQQSQQNQYGLPSLPIPQSTLSQSRLLSSRLRDDSVSSAGGTDESSTLQQQQTHSFLQPLPGLYERTSSVSQEQSQQQHQILLPLSQPQQHSQNITSLQSYVSTQQHQLSHFSVDGMLPIVSTRLLRPHQFPPLGSALLDAEARLSRTGSPSTAADNAYLQAMQGDIPDWKKPPPLQHEVSKLVGNDAFIKTKSSTEHSSTSGSGHNGSDSKLSDGETAKDCQWEDDLFQPRSIEEMIANPRLGQQQQSQDRNEFPQWEHAEGGHN